MSFSKRQSTEEHASEQLNEIDTHGLIARRELMRRSAIFGAVATLGTFTGLLKTASAQSAAGGTVKVGLDSGAFTPILKTFAPEFKAATGLTVEFESYPLGNMYDQNLLSLRQKTARFDAFDFWQNFAGDFGPYLTPLEEVGSLETLNFSDVAKPFQQLNYYQNKLVGITIDGDLFIDTYRSDLFDDAAEKTAFKAKYGYDLIPAKTYKQYRDIAEFFTRPSKNLYGAVEVTSFFVYAFFMNHFVQIGAEKGVNYGEIFDANMKPNIANAMGEEAIRRYIEMTAFMPKDLAKAMPWDVGRQLYFAGHIAQANWWTDMAKGASDPAISKVADKIRCAQSWGEVTMLPYGRAMGIAANSQNKKGAFTAISWIQQSANATRWVAETFAQSLMDPWRVSMFESPKATFPLESASGFADNFAQTSLAALHNPKVYLDISIPGTNQYMSSIIQHVQAAINGQVEPMQALQDISGEFEETTETYGRDLQIAHYAEYRARMVKNGYWT
jgi:multiple sugar transport system substrate-binding protein